MTNPAPREWGYADWHEDQAAKFIAAAYGGWDTRHAVAASIAAAHASLAVSARLLDAAERDAARDTRRTDT